MTKLLATAFLATLLAAGVCLAGSPIEGFVPIKGAQFKLGRGAKQNGRLVRIEDFEILDHPVTNREYKVFVDETSHPAPLHWTDGRIPAGKEEFPVIFVNRKDVGAFLDWLSEKEGRACRLPTSHEFEYAARGRLAGKTYPWGDDEPQGRANFDAQGNRRFDRWADYLAPARSGARNGFGLYGMAGNVGQMTIDYPDPAPIGFKYRIEDRQDLEHGVMGGSWAKSKSYLRCGDTTSGQAGMRLPDIGFRPVRQPATSDWSTQVRKLCAIPSGENAIFVGWALVRQDAPSTRFNVYRSTERGESGFRVNKEPIRTSTTFTDTDVKQGTRYQYYVRAVAADGKEGPRSEWVGVNAGPSTDGVVTSFKPLCQQARDRGIVPIFGDLDGDGTLDCVIRLDNGNYETSQDPGVPVQIEAFTSYGRSLWRRDLCRHDHCYGSANNVPFNVWDMDGDGRAEVIARLQISDEVYLAILNGMTGEVLRKTPWPPMATDFAKSSTRIHLSIAYLDGKHPAMVTQTGLYENEVFVAFDAKLNRLWEFDSFAETNGSGGHKIEVVDVDGDGRQEVFDGTTCLKPDGTVRWSIYKMHPDIVSIHDHLPNRPGLEVFYIVESNPYAGVYMVDASTGQVLWKSNRDDDPLWSHGHKGWSADIWDGWPGMECVSNRAGHRDDNLLLFTADGRKVMEHFPNDWTPIEWDGDATRELIRPRDFQIGDFNGKEVVPKTAGSPKRPESAGLTMVADLYGDFRDELVVLGTSEKGEPTVSVITAVTPIDKRFVAPSETLDYRLWLGRNMGGGYPSVYTQPLVGPGGK